jgi:hypothetical protein
MKKKAALLVCILIAAIICFIIYICYSNCFHSDADVNSVMDYTYYPTASQTVNENLLSSSKDLADQWNFYSTGVIVKGYESVDAISLPINSYKKILADLEDLLRGKTLYGLVQPAGVSDYNEYAKDLLDCAPSAYMLWANFGPPTNTLFDGVDCLYNFRIIMPDRSRCYFISFYNTNVHLTEKCYVFYTEDPQLIDGILKWADTYIAMNYSASGT